MNKLTAILFTTIVFSLSGTSISSASDTNEQIPQAKDLGLLEMSSVIGAGQVFWQTNASQTLLYQLDDFYGLHQETVSPGVHNIGGHPISTGTSVWLWCQKSPAGYPWRQAQFAMPNHDVTFNCNL